MAVSDRDIDRAVKYGLEDFDWFWVVVELATGRRPNTDDPPRLSTGDRSSERDA